MFGALIQHSALKLEFRAGLTCAGQENETRELLDQVCTAVSAAECQERDILSWMEAKDCSVITAEYCLGGRPIGNIGLIGPQRINYSKVISIMAQVIKELNKSLRNQSLE